MRKLYPYRGGHKDGTRHPVIVVGAGPVGLALALDLGLRGIPVVVLDREEGPGEGSRAICFAKRTLEIADRLGAGDAALKEGVQWNLGRVFHGPDQVFEFNLQPEPGHKLPAFINLQQPYFEEYLFEAIESSAAPIEIRGGHEVMALTVEDDHARLSVNTPDGPYNISGDWVVACDGARSPMRGMLDLGFEGRVFEDNFLIADVHMTADFPTERWFWFEPPFEGAGQSALLHKQPDNIWRIDFQLGWEIDRDAELDETRVRKRVDAMLKSQAGTVPDYELDWCSIYTFQCRRMETFQKGRVLFAGDSAHQVSPFGARGANSGVQDAENLAWKLAMVLDGKASERLIETYHEERSFAADENILNSTRATDFMTPKSAISRTFRDAVLILAKDQPFARPLVNSGRLSVPCVYGGLSLNGPDTLDGPKMSRVGAVCPDAPLAEGYLLDRLRGDFMLMGIDTDLPRDTPVTSLSMKTGNDDPTGALRARYLGDAPQAVYLIRPDQHIAARWTDFSAGAVDEALRIATGGAL